MDTEWILSILKTTGQVIWELLLLIAVAISDYAEKFWRLFVPRPLKSLEGEIILLTGAGNGIGKEIANELSGKGATIVCWDVETEANNKVVEELKRKGNKAYAYTVDISERQNVVKAADMIRSDIGDVTIVMNNAGICPISFFLDAREESYEKIMQVNFLSHQWILRQFLPKMIEKGKGHVVTTASIGAFLPCKCLAVYIGSKHAVQGFIESLRQEINIHPKKPDIKFTTCCPAIVNTRLLDGINLKPKYENVEHIITPQYVAKQIVNGFRRNYEHVFIPPWSIILVFMASCLPYKLHRQILSGILHVDIEFVGKKSN